MGSLYLKYQGMNIYYIRFTSLLVFLLTLNVAFSQKNSNDQQQLVQFSGLILDGSDQAELFPVPYTNILIKGKNRGQCA